MKSLKRIYELITGRDEITNNCRQIVAALSRHIGPRSLSELENLQKAHQFVQTAFLLHGSLPYQEEFSVDGMRLSNVCVDLEGSRYPESIIVIGAHYDTVEGSYGANDNATGIAALLEIHRLLVNVRLERTVRLCAFVLEEPPFFGTNKMGSYVSASRARRRKDSIELMISLDMLGYGGRLVKQGYPLESMKRDYPKYGNYLVCSALPRDAHTAHLARKHFNRHSRTKMRKIIAPASLNGVIQSDHHSFHQNGYPAVLFTDTGFYRNEYYHTENDTYETINYRFLGCNVYSIARAVKDLARIPSAHFKPKGKLRDPNP